MKEKYDILFTPAKIGSLEIKNRFVMVPMEPTALIDWTFHTTGYTPEKKEMIVNRAKDGVGLIVLGAISCKSFANQEWLHNHPEAFDGIEEVVEEVHSYGSKIFPQITVGAGRNFPITKEWNDNWDKYEPIMGLSKLNNSADAGLPNRWVADRKTTQMTVEEIHETVHALAETAFLFKQKGFDGVDVHAVHEGYLLDQFTMPYTNHRTDEYGGTLENRLRFPCEIVKAIKERCGKDFPVILRYSVQSRVRDFGKGIIPADKDSVEIGRTLEESKRAIQILTEAGYDAFNADNGTYDSWYYAHPPVYMPLNCNLDDSAAVKPYTDKPIICAGRMELDTAAEAIMDGKIDFVGIARQFLADEEYLTKVREDREEEVRPCIACHTGCFPMGLWKDSGCAFGPLGNCALNPRTKNEAKYVFTPAETPKKIAVIGAGIAGMEFALKASLRGHTVEIFEKSNRLGGVFNEAAAFPFKEKDKQLLNFYAVQMERSNIKVHYNTTVTSLDEIEADEYVIATGALETRTLSIPGADKTITAVDFLKNGMPCGETVAVIGGGLTGCEIAYALALEGKKPYILEMQEDILIAPGSCMANTSYLRDAFDYYQVPLYTSAAVKEIQDGRILFTDENGNHVELPAETVVTSIGYISGTSLEETENVHVIGDAREVSNLKAAIHGANDLALVI